MANYIMNRIKFYGRMEDVNELMRSIENDGNDHQITGFGTIDFNKIDPCPKSLNIDCGGIQSDAIEVVKKLAKHSEHVYRREPDFEKDMKAVQDIAQRHNMHVGEVCSIGMAYILNLANYGAPTWYEWNKAHWGTSSNAWNVPNSESECVMFETKWTAPHSVIEKLAAKFPNVSIEHQFASEDICGEYCGTYHYENGVFASKDEYEGGEAISFGCQLWDIDESEYLKEISES